MGYILHNNDCVKVLPYFKDSVDLIITSPPYDDLREYGGHEFNFRAVADAIIPALKDGGQMAWIVQDAIRNYQETGNSFRQALYFQEHGLLLHQTIIFQKANESGKSHTRYAEVTEYIFILTKGRPKTFNPIIDKPNAEANTRQSNTNKGRNKAGELGSYVGSYTVPKFSKRINVWRYNTSRMAPDFKDAHKHPAIYPLALGHDLVTSYSNPGDLVLDPMCGSGTTIRAAVNLDRNAVGIDIEPSYIELAKRRMSQLTLFGET